MATLPSVRAALLLGALLAGCASSEAPPPVVRIAADAWPVREPGPTVDVAAAPGGLDAILARIATSNPTLAQAQASLDAARAATREADATLWPELSLNLGYVATDEPGQAFGLLLNQQDLTLGPDFDATPGTTENWRKELRLDWALFAPGRGPRREAAREGEEAARLAREAVERRLLNAGVQAWLGLGAARELEAVATESVDVVARRLEITERRVAEGAALRADALRLEVRLAAARREAARARLDVRRARAALNALAGAAPADVLEPGPDELPAVAVELEGADLSELLARAESERLDLRAAAHEARAVGLARRGAEEARLPTLGLFAAYDVDGPNPAIDRDLDSTTVGLGLRVPFSRRTGAAIERSAAEERRARARLRALAVEVAREVHDAWAAVEVADETLALAESSVGAAEEAYRIVARAQDAGGATVTDVLEAEDARRRARVAVVAARAGAAIARARLAGATGGVR